MNSPLARDSKDSRTLYCGNLSDAVTEELLYELFLQAGPIGKVTIPKEKDGKQRTFGFIEFVHKVSADYAFKVMRGTELFGRILQIKYRNNVVTSPEPRLNHESRTKYIYACPMGCRDQCPVTGFNGSVTAYLAEVQPSSPEQTDEIQEIYSDDNIYSNRREPPNRPDRWVDLIPQMRERYNQPLLPNPQPIGISHFMLHSNVHREQQQNMIWQQQHFQQRFSLIHAPFPLGVRFQNNF